MLRDCLSNQVFHQGKLQETGLNRCGKGRTV
jgi:hypothetical protein